MLQICRDNTYTIHMPLSLIPLLFESSQFMNYFYINNVFLLIISAITSLFLNLTHAIWWGTRKNVHKTYMAVKKINMLTIKNIIYLSKNIWILIMWKLVKCKYSILNEEKHIQKSLSSLIKCNEWIINLCKTSAIAYISIKNFNVVHMLAFSKFYDWFLNK